MGHFLSKFQSLFKQHVGAPNFCKIGCFSIWGIFSELQAQFGPTQKLNKLIKKTLRQGILGSNKHKLDYEVET